MLHRKGGLLCGVSPDIMRVVPDADGTRWAMADPGRAYLVYDLDGGPVRLDLGGDGARYAVRWLDEDGGVTPGGGVQGGGVVVLTPPDGRPTRRAAWLSLQR